MRRIALVLVILASVLVPVASASAATPQQQINALKTKIAAMQRQIRTLRADVALIYNCQYVAPIMQWGGPTGGYIWGDVASGQQYITTAIDYAPEDLTGLTPDVDYFWALFYDNRCGVDTARTRSLSSVEHAEHLPVHARRAL